MRRLIVKYGARVFLACLLIVVCFVLVSCEGDPFVMRVDEVGNSEVIWKGVDEYVTNTTTLQNDDELYFWLEPNSWAKVELSIISYGTVDWTPLLKCSFSVPTNGKWWANVVGLNGSGGFDSLYRSWDNTTTWLGESTVEIRFTRSVFAMIKTGDVAGYVYFQWAQNTAKAQDTYVKAGSMLEVIRDYE